MQRKSDSGRLNPNAKFTLNKPKENSLLAKRGHLCCENGINFPMPTGLLPEIVKDSKKENLFIQLKMQMKL